MHYTEEKEGEKKGEMTMNRRRQNGLTLQQKLMLGCSALLVGVLALLGAEIIPQRLRSFDLQLDGRIALIARMVAESRDAEQALTDGAAPERWVAHLESMAAETENVDYIVVADCTGKRVYHPNHALIGQYFVGGDEVDAEQGSEPYITTRHGTEVDQRRAFHTVYNEEDEPIGFVMVSASMERIQRQKQELMKRFLLVFAPALLAGLAASWLLARSVRNALLGHEPSAFARMYLQREDVLDHLSECLLAVTPDGKILFTNAQTRKLFRWEALPEDFLLWEEIHAAFDEGVSHVDLLTEWAEYTFLAKTVPLNRESVLIILRNRMEYIRIDQQLIGTNHVIEALRANTHEFLNKLHIISGLLQIGETQKAVAFIDGVFEDVENNYQSIIRQLKNRTVAALVLGKTSHARELDIQFSLRRDITLPPHSAYLSSRELVTIVGNLVENAFEAVKNAPLKQVGLFIGEDANGLTITVDDTGHGMTEEQINTVRLRRYTTKGEGHGFGLRLIQQIVAGRNGYLDIESEPGEGSSFTVNFTEKREMTDRR